MQKAMSESVGISLGNFLELYGVGNACITIREKYPHYLFEEECPEDVYSSELYDSIKDRMVYIFNVIGGGMYKVELFITLK